MCIHSTKVSAILGKNLHFNCFSRFGLRLNVLGSSEGSEVQTRLAVDLVNFKLLYFVVPSSYCAKSVVIGFWP